MDDSKMDDSPVDQSPVDNSQSKISLLSILDNRELSLDHHESLINHSQRSTSRLSIHNPQQLTVTSIHNPQRSIFASGSSVHNPQQQQFTVASIHNPQQLTVTSIRNPQKSTVTSIHNPQRSLFASGPSVHNHQRLAVTLQSIIDNPQLYLDQELLTDCSTDSSNSSDHSQSTVSIYISPQTCSDRFKLGINNLNSFVKSKALRPQIIQNAELLLGYIPIDQSQSSTNQLSIDSRSLFDDLPDDLFNRIISYLTLFDRIRCRKVSVNWSNRLKNIFKSIRDLVVSNDYTIHNRWWQSNDRFSLRDQFLEKIHLKHTQFILIALRRIKFKNGLKVKGFKYFEYFTSIEQIEIGSLKLVEEDKKIETINLPNLRVLYIEQILTSCQDFYLPLQLPTLKSVYFGGYSIDYINILDKNSIRYLEFDLSASDKLLNYKNVNVLKCNRILEAKIFQKLLKSKFPDLIELHCNIKEFTNFRQTLLSNLHRKMRFIYNALFNRFKRLDEHSKQVKVFFHGILINGLDKNFVDYRFFDCLLHQHYHNQDLLPASLPVRTIDYEIFRSLSNLPRSIEFMNSFNSRYPAIQEVRIKSANNSADLIRFLNGFQKLSSLILEYCGFEAELYDQISRLDCLTSSLVKLRYLNKKRIFTEMPFKFEFLHHFESNLYSRSMIIDTVSRVKAPAYFKFYFDSNRRQILKIYKYKNDKIDYKVLDFNSSYVYEDQNLKLLSCAMNCNENFNFFTNWLDSNVSN